MNINRKHIVFKVLTICMVFTLMFPSAFKFAHVFEHHEHIICSGDQSTHIHQVDLDCEFHKFQLNSQFFSSIHNEDLFQELSYYRIPVLTYKFLNNHRPLSFSLRGPPLLV